MKHLNYFWAFFVLLAGLTFGSCSDDDILDEEKPVVPEPKPERVTTDEIYYANEFAHDVLHDIYLWNHEIMNDLKRLNPKTNKEPIKTVRQIRYHQGDTEIDKWTSLTNDMEGLQSNAQGVNTSFGYNLMFAFLSDDSDEVCGIVTHVYKDGPAAKAGLKRGDLLIQLNGKKITQANMADLYYLPDMTVQVANMIDGKMKMGKKVTMKAVTMYEDPILVKKVFDVNGKKVGYLAYTSFDLLSAEKLVEISREFKNQGVEELILDLRYNGGGYVFTEQVLASMLAPYDAVKKKDVFETEIWNEEMTAMLKKEGVPMEERLDFVHKINIEGIYKNSINTQNVNLGLKKIYGLVSRGTASASESIFVGLLPYYGSNIQLIGQPTHGKYCTGMMMSPEDVYGKKAHKDIKDWGIYVMINRYADKNGNNPCMPNGFKPDVEERDNPVETYQLGDENEALLKVALKMAGKEYPQTKSAPQPFMMREVSIDKVPHSFLFGHRIDQNALGRIQQVTGR